ncbi:MULTISPECIES: hypothetical protein [Chitinophagaceae]
MKNIIYQTLDGSQTDMEFQYWDKVLLKDISKRYFFDNRTLSTVKDDAVIFYSCDRVRLHKGFATYFDKFKNYTLIHLSNESMNHLTGYYKKARAVIRATGWTPNKVQKNVFFVPVGYMSGYGNETNIIPAFEDRNLVWSFAGAIKADRQVMLDAFKDIEPNFYFKSQGWGDGGAPMQKTMPELIEIYKHTIFAPSPLGNNNFECFRTMEVLEYGCIPIIPRFLGYDPYKYLFGDHPLVVVDNWEEGATIVKEYLENPVALKQKSKEVSEWYRLYKERLARDVARIISGDIAHLESEQFVYQQQAHKDLGLRWKYFRHFALRVYWKRLTGKITPSNLK